MLVLVRRPGERVVINGELAITVVEIAKGQVRLGFEAPRHYQILRQELADEIQAENRPADRQALDRAMDVLGGAAAPPARSGSAQAGADPPG